MQLFFAKASLDKMLEVSQLNFILTNYLFKKRTFLMFIKHNEHYKMLLSETNVEWLVKLTLINVVPFNVKENNNV